MATEDTQSFSGIVANFATAVQGAATQLVDFTVGSVLNAIAEAVAGVALWLQGLYLQVLALTRAATSSGTDLDSWFADYGFAREAAQAAYGTETFYRYTPTNSTLIPVGATVPCWSLAAEKNFQTSCTLPGIVDVSTTPALS